MPLAKKPLKACLLTAKDKSLEVVPDGNSQVIQVPAQAPDKIASVIALEMDKQENQNPGRFGRGSKEVELMKVVRKLIVRNSYRRASRQTDRWILHDCPPLLS